MYLLYWSIQINVFTSFGCTGAFIPNQGTQPFNFGYTVAAPLNVSTYASRTYNITFDQYINQGVFFNYPFYGVSAYAAGSNQIIGLESSYVNTYSLCNIFGTGATINNPGNVYRIAGTYDVNYFIRNYYSARNVYYNFGAATATLSPSILPQSTCYTSTFSVFGVSFPPANPVLTIPSTMNGPFDAGVYRTYGYTVFSYTVPISRPNIAVKFLSGGETHYGWIEIDFDPVTNQMICVDKGFNSCSIEDALFTGTPTSACIGIGETVSSVLCCKADYTVVNFNQINSPTYTASNSITCTASAFSFMPPILRIVRFRLNNIIV